MPTLLLTFANSQTTPLKTLTDEYEGVSDALRDREIQGDFTVVSKPIATRAQIHNEIRAREQDICLFLFSGHAGRDRLELGDGAANSDGIAALLGRCTAHKLNVVILNGCSTAGQVDRLLAQKVPVVIATSSAVNDETATRFSIALFTELSKNRLPICEAFNRAIDVAQVYGRMPRVHRGSLDTGETDSPVWGIYYYPSSESLTTSWRLGVESAVNAISMPPTNELRDLVGQGYIRDALEKMILCDKISDASRMQLASLTDLEEHQMLNLIDFREARVERAKITNAVLKIINKLD